MTESPARPPSVAGLVHWRISLRVQFRRRSFQRRAHNDLPSLEAAGRLVRSLCPCFCCTLTSHSFPALRIRQPLSDPSMPCPFCLCPFCFIPWCCLPNTLPFFALFSSLSRRTQDLPHRLRTRLVHRLHGHLARARRAPPHHARRGVHSRRRARRVAHGLGPADRG